MAATFAPTTADLAAMTPDEFVGLMRRELARPGNGMHDHPFLLDLESGRATLEQIAAWTEQFYLHISRMLPWIGAIYVRCPHEAVRTTLVKNLAEECMGTFTNTKAHPELLLEFARAIGADADAIRGAEQVPAGRRLTEYFEFMGLCREWFVPLSAIAIGLESFVPATFARMVNALKANYGLSDEQVVFFTMHITADEEHGDEGIELVSAYATTPEGRKHVYDCTLDTGRLFHEMWMLYRDAAA